MAIKLPTPIGAFFDAESRNDAEALGQAFAEDGVVLDEGHVIQGRPRHQALAGRDPKKISRTRWNRWRPKRMRDETIVTCRLSGSFPGSPIKVRFIFKLDGNAITSLEVRS